MHAASLFRLSAALVCAVVATGSLSACSSPEYHGFDSGLDGVLWRQLAFYEDPLSRSLYQPTADEPSEYLDALPGARWDGTAASARDSDLAVVPRDVVISVA